MITRHSQRGSGPHLFTIVGWFIAAASGIVLFAYAKLIAGVAVTLGIFLLRLRLKSWLTGRS
jgi:hypothetical protein